MSAPVVLWQGSVETRYVGEQRRYVRITRERDLTLVWFYVRSDGTMGQWTGEFSGRCDELSAHLASELYALRPQS